MSAKAKTKPKDPVADAARRALDDANGNVREATRMLEHAVRSSRSLFDLLMDPLVSNACYDAVRAQCRVERRKIWQPPAEKLKASKVAGAFRVVQLAAGSLLMFPLPGGMKLGEAKRDDVAQAASFYDAQSADMASKGRWLRLVLQSLPADKVVADVLTDQRLRELQSEAARHV